MKTLNGVKREVNLSFIIEMFMSINADSSAMPDNNVVPLTAANLEYYLDQYDNIAEQGADDFTSELRREFENWLLTQK